MTPTKFPGFSSPSFTQVPNEVFDTLLPDLSKPELKVLLYVIRRTFGFGKNSDAISLRQIAEGITTRDGQVLDRGTGLPRSSVANATKSLVEKGILEVRQVRDEAGDFTTNIYSLRFIVPTEVVQPVDHPSPNAGQGWSSQTTTGGPASGPGVVQHLDPQKKDVQQKVHKRDNGLDETKNDETEITQSGIVESDDAQSPITNIDRYRSMTLEERLAQFEANQAQMKRLPRLS